MKFSKESIKNVVETTMKKVLNKVNEVKSMLHEKVQGTILEETRFDLHHFTTVCVVSLLVFFITLYSTGFNTTRVDAASMSTPVVKTYNKDAIEIQYGDASKIAALAKEILSEQVSSVVEPKEIANSGLQTVYAIGDYIATVDINPTLGKSSATLSIETKKTYVKNDMKKIVTPTESEKVEVLDGMTYTYNVSLSIVDTEAPKIKLVSDDTTIMETDDFDVKDYIAAVVDNVDGVMTNYVIENDVPRDSDGTLAHGRHYVTIKATDSSGNTAEETLIVRCYKEEKTTSSSSSNKTNSNITYASNGPVGSTIASAALAQLGRYQDCTMLVTNSLRAVGINFHGWPYEYLSLGTIVPYSQAMPGDIVVYSGHVAIYIGNGMCVHGGFYGTQTVIYSIYIPNGAFTIVRV